MFLPVEIIGTGRASPDACVAVPSSDGRIHHRHRCTGETQIDLAARAATDALSDADVAPDAVDLVISGSAVPYQPIPAMAPLVMGELGIEDGAAAAFDVNSTCLGFLTALDTAARLVTAGVHRTALVVCAEIASRALPWEESPEVAALFGDGAAAAVVRHGGGEAGIRASLLRSYPSAFDACGIGAGGTRFAFHADREAFARNATFRMDGRVLYRLVARYMRHFVDEVLDRAGWRREDVHLVVPHQASSEGLAHMIRVTGFSQEQVVDVVAAYGNQVSASIPFALDIARRSGRVPPGTRLLLVGTSAGVSLGGLAMEV